MWLWLSSCHIDQLMQWQSVLKLLTSRLVDLAFHSIGYFNYHRYCRFSYFSRSQSRTKEQKQKRGKHNLTCKSRSIRSMNQIILMRSRKIAYSLSITHNYDKETLCIIRKQFEEEKKYSFAWKIIKNLKKFAPSCQFLHTRSRLETASSVLSAPSSQ